ncbi:hypothetical protein ACIPJN_27885 [Streptomyces sp. NPDC086796]|uniref:hypothetical protein n=1 Tax=unclassified Streptomyces TaxID=2593676 RepID=UPI0038170720
MGALSDAIRTAPPHSPPTAMPWTARGNTGGRGAVTPICAWVGSTPTRKVAAPIMISVEGLRTYCDIRMRRFPGL